MRYNLKAIHTNGHSGANHDNIDEAVLAFTTSVMRWRNEASFIRLELWEIVGSPFRPGAREKLIAVYDNKGVIEESEVFPHQRYSRGLFGLWQ